MSGFGDRLTDRGQGDKEPLDGGGVVEIRTSVLDDPKMAGLVQLALQEAFMGARYDLVPGNTLKKSLDIAKHLGLVKIEDDTPQADGSTSGEVGQSQPSRNIPKGWAVQAGVVDRSRTENSGLSKGWGV